MCFIVDIMIAGSFHSRLSLDDCNFVFVYSSITLHQTLTFETLVLVCSILYSIPEI